MSYDLAMKGSAVFSPNGVYRYRLTREWDLRLERLVFIMLNPSVANASRLDPTVTRCLRRAITGGYGALDVLNLFALISTDPKALERHSSPVGPENDAYIETVTAFAGRVICAWGSMRVARARGAAVLLSLYRRDIRPWALKLCGDGSPMHPLHLKYALQPFPMIQGGAP